MPFLLVKLLYIHVGRSKVEMLGFSKDNSSFVLRYVYSKAAGESVCKYPSVNGIKPTQKLANPFLLMQPFLNFFQESSPVPLSSHPLSVLKLFLQICP